MPVLTGWLSGFIQQGATGQVSGHGVFIVCWLRKPFFSYVKPEQGLRVFFNVGLGLDVRPRWTDREQSRGESPEKSVG